MGLAGLGVLLWGGHFYAYSRGLAGWNLDLGLFVLAAALWLGRSHAAALLASLGMLFAIAVRPYTDSFVALNLAYAAAALVLAPRLSSRLSRPAASSGRRPVAAASAAVVFVVIAVYAARPAWLMARPELRRAALAGLSPAFPIQDPKTLTPAAARLRRHVVALAQDIGERSIYQPKAQEKAKDYIVARLREAGFEPRVADYASLHPLDFARGVPFRNVEAVLAADSGAPTEVWVVGAHYDSAPGTPGADDNASGVAVLLELAKRLKDSPRRREVRLVFFGTEEPPSFGTRDMGSLHYARALRAQGVRIYGLINLEMMGFYNSAPGSQLFPPFLSLFYPGRGAFLAGVGNLRSVGLLSEVRSAWKKSSILPFEAVVLPSVFSTVALSDQLNFWGQGDRAVMLSDTSFFRNPRYHQNGDTPETLDYEKMAAAVDGVAGVVAPPLAKAP